MFGFMGDTTLGLAQGHQLRPRCRLGDRSVSSRASKSILRASSPSSRPASRGTGNDTTYGAAASTFGVEIRQASAWCSSISFEVETTASEVIKGRRRRSVRCPTSCRPRPRSRAARPRNSCCFRISRNGTGRSSISVSLPPAIQPARSACAAGEPALSMRISSSRCAFRSRARRHPDDRNRVHRDRRGRTSSGVVQGDQQVLQANLPIDPTITPIDPRTSSAHVS